MSSIRKHKLIIAIEWVIVLFGFYLRFMRFYSNPPIAPDCIVRYFNIVNHSFADLLKLGHSIHSLVHDPYGFLLIQKLILVSSSNNAFILRLFFFFCGMAGLLLFRRVKNLFIGTYGGLLALGLFAVCDRHIKFSTVFSPYMLDVLVVLIWYILLVRMHDAVMTIPRIILFGLAGAISVWFSLPSVFVLGGVGISLSIDMILDKDWKRLPPYVFIFLLWFSSFSVYYFYALRTFANWTYIIRDWQDYLMPQTADFLSIVNWLGQRFGGIFINPLNLPPLAGSVLFFIGSWDMFRRERLKFMALILPFVLMIIASMFQKYPFGERVMIFLIPAFYLLIGRGWEHLFLKEKSQFKPIMSMVLLVFLLYKPITMTFHYFPLQPYHHPIIAVFENVKKEFKEGDIIYVHFLIKWEFLYYNTRYKFPEGQYVMGQNCRKTDCYSAIEELKGYKRIWFITHQRTGLEMNYILTALRNIGNQVYAGGHLYRSCLYEINPPPDQ